MKNGWEIPPFVVIDGRSDEARKIDAEIEAWHRAKRKRVCWACLDRKIWRIYLSLLAKGGQKNW